MTEEFSIIIVQAKLAEQRAEEARKDKIETEKRLRKYNFEIVDGIICCIMASPDSLKDDFFFFSNAFF